MTRTNRSLLATASMAALLTAGAGQAFAGSNVNGGGSTLAFPTDIAIFTDLVPLTTAVFGNAKATKNGVAAPFVNFGAVGSGGGTKAFLGNDYTFLNVSPSAGKYLLNGKVITVPAPVFGPGTTVHYGASDGVLTTVQISAYKAGLATTNGPLIQLPAFGTPITIPFVDGTIAAATLNDADLCAIFSGNVTTWNDARLSHPLTTGNTINVVFRAEGSGTTFLLTSHLATVCPTAKFASGSAATKSGVTFAATQYFAGTFSQPPAALTFPTTHFIGAKGSGGVQGAIVAIQKATAAAPASFSASVLRNSTDTGATYASSTTVPSAAGYIGPDYTSIAKASANSPAFLPTPATINVASLINRNDTTKTPLQPTTGNTTTALATAVAPPSTQATASDPTKWVPAVADPSSGYPIVGFTNLIVSQCYKDANVTNGITTFLKNLYNNSTVFLTDIQNGGFVQVPKLLSTSYVAAINNTFLTNNAGFNPSLAIGDRNVCANGGSKGFAGR